MYVLVSSSLRSSVNPSFGCGLGSLDRLGVVALLAGNWIPAQIELNSP